MTLGWGRRGGGCEKAMNVPWLGIYYLFKPRARGFSSLACLATGVSNTYLSSYCYYTYILPSPRQSKALCVLYFILIYLLSCFRCLALFLFLFIYFLIRVGLTWFGQVRNIATLSDSAAPIANLWPSSEAPADISVTYPPVHCKGIHITANSIDS